MDSGISETVVCLTVVFAFYFAYLIIYSLSICI